MHFPFLKGLEMQAELVIDLNGLGTDVGKALGRDVAVLPSLNKVAALWSALGVEVTSMHLITPGYSIRSSERPNFGEIHAATWWETESVFIEDSPFDAHISFCALGDDGPIGLHSLVVATALQRSDVMAQSGVEEDGMVIVMSNSAAVASAVTHARGMPVMIAGTIVPDSGLAHARLDPSWMGMLTNRFAAFSIPDIELRNGRPWADGVAVCTPYGGTEGRDLDAGVLPSFAASVAIFDPEFFRVFESDGDFTPDAAGVASVVHTLGLGELVHVEVGSQDSTPDLAESRLVAALYRYANDHPDVPIVVASGRPGLIVATSDLEGYGLINERRFLRLCLPMRETTFNETAFEGRTAAARVVIEGSLSEPLFAEGEKPTPSLVQTPAVAEDDIDQSEDSAPQTEERPSSPTLVLYTNPNTAKEASNNWRHSTQRRFLIMGATAAEAVPADAPDGQFLPVSLGGCTDFSLRRPDLRPGCVVEGILDASGERWIIVSDPIERRRAERQPTAQAA